MGQRLTKQQVEEHWARSHEQITIRQEVATIAVVERREEHGYHVWRVQVARGSVVEVVTKNGTGWFSFPDFTEIHAAYLKALQSAWRRREFEEEKRKAEEPF